MGSVSMVDRAGPNQMGSVDQAGPDRWVLFSLNNEWDVNREKTNVWTLRKGNRK